MESLSSHKVKDTLVRPKDQFVSLCELFFITGNFLNGGKQDISLAAHGDLLNCSKYRATSQLAILGKIIPEYFMTDRFHN